MECQVGPVETGVGDVLGVDPEGFHYVVCDLRRGGGRERENAAHLEFPRQAGNLEVVGPEVVSPIR